MKPQEYHKKPTKTKNKIKFGYRTFPKNKKKTRFGPSVSKKFKNIFFLEDQKNPEKNQFVTLEIGPSSAEILALEKRG